MKPLIKQLVTSIMLGSCSLLPPTLYAEAADWYRWESVKTGRYICRQVDPGSGWIRHSGPYLDAGCRQLRPPPTALSSNRTVLQSHCEAAKFGLGD